MDINDFRNNYSNKLLCCDSSKMICEIPNCSVDCIFTDPPYGLGSYNIRGDENLDLFKRILPELFRILKKDGFFITFFSTKFLNKLFLDNPFNYYWQIILSHPDSSNFSNRIGDVKYMSCIVFSKGNASIKNKGKDLFIDTPGKMIEPDEGYIQHPTPKSKTFIREVIKMFTVEGDLIFDPFSGSGSVLLASMLTGRKYLGCEIENKYFNIAESRLSKFKHKLSDAIS